MTSKDQRFIPSLKAGLRRILARAQVSDAAFARIMFFIRYKRWLDLKHPVSLMENMQWYKIKYDLRRYSHLVDKLAVRDYVAETLGEEYLIPIYGVFETADEIDFGRLPSQNVIKASLRQQDGSSLLGWMYNGS